MSDTTKKSKFDSSQLVDLFKGEAADRYQDFDLRKWFHDACAERAAEREEELSR